MNNGGFSTYRLIYIDELLQCTLHIYIKGGGEVVMSASVKRIILEQFQKGLN